MDKLGLVESFSDFKETKNIDRVTMMSIMEEVFRNIIIKRCGTDENIDFIINTDRGDLEIWRRRVIVNDDDFEDEVLEIPYSEAVKIEPDFEVGEEVSDQIPMDEFGRRAILAVRQNLQSRVSDLEKEGVYKKYKDRVGEIVVGEVYQTWKKETLILDDEGNELILPKNQQIPSD